MAKMSALDYAAGRIIAICENRAAVCQLQIDTLQKQFATVKSPPDRMAYFGEQPDLHVHVEGFLAGIKSLLDLLVQLLSTERVVGNAIDGFHRHGKEYGGRVLNQLTEKNACKYRWATADRIGRYLRNQKSVWIDRAVGARDVLVHPTRGMWQLMFEFELGEKDGRLAVVGIHPPAIYEQPIDEYARQTLQHAKSFTTGFLELVRT